MKSFVSKMLTIFLSFAILITFSNTEVKAAINNESIYQLDGQTVKVKVLTDNAKLSIVRTEDDSTITLVNYDKTNNSFSIKETNKLSKAEKLTNVKIDNDKINKKIEDYELSLITPLSYAASYYLVDYQTCSFFENAYFYYSDRTWSVYNSSNSNKYRAENESNSGDLLSLKSAVDSLAGYEVAAVAAANTSVVATVTAVLTAPTGIGAVIGVLTAIGAGIGSAAALWNCYRSRNTADMYWTRV